MCPYSNSDEITSSSAVSMLAMVHELKKIILPIAISQALVAFGSSIFGQFCDQTSKSNPI